MMANRSSSRVAIVTGASRGIGRGVALGLGEAGWTVYVTGRTLDVGQSERPGTLLATAREIDEIGGTGIAARCDHRVDADSAALFDRVMSERDHLDLLVNNATAYTTDVGPPEDVPFWEQPLEVWDLMHAVGLRSHFVASVHAARAMISAGRGLIVNVSSIGAIKYTGHVSYNVVKAGVDMLTAGTAVELRDHGVAVVSLWPRLTRTEGVAAHPERFPVAKAWSPILNGRIVAALAEDPAILDLTGQALDIGAMAARYGIHDVDGRQPEPRPTRD
jgi:dehydrogenase/reductase SDR family protein 1